MWSQERSERRDQMTDNFVYTWNKNDSAPLSIGRGRGKGEEDNGYRFGRRRARFFFLLGAALMSRSLVRAI